MKKTTWFLRNEIPSSAQLKKYIDENLNPKKCNIIDPRKENYVNNPSKNEILEELKILELGYYKASSIWSSDDFQIHLKWESNACFINTYFVKGLQAWKANIDIQPVFYHYKEMTYICVYISKAEDETSEAMKQAAKEASVSGKSNFEKMRAAARAYSTKHECSVQEAVYLIMPEVWLRKTFPKVIFLNSNIPEKRYRIFRRKGDLDELPNDSTDISQPNMLDHFRMANLQ